MSSRNLPLPFFPVAPETYDRRYMAEVVRAFSVYLVQMQNPGEGRNTFTVFTALQTNDVGLEPGAVFQVDGVLRVSLADRPYPAGVGATGAVGAVTVSTP